MSIHIMQCFEFLKKTSQLLDKVNRDFFFQPKYNIEEGLPMVALDPICKPKEIGVLELRKMKAVNLASQCKLAQKILQDNSNLCTIIMKQKYFKKY